MTLEQRVDALEKQMAVQNSGGFSVKDGEGYINSALLKGSEINAAHVQTAYDVRMGVKSSK